MPRWGANEQTPTAVAGGPQKVASEKLEFEQEDDTRAGREDNLDRQEPRKRTGSRTTSIRERSEYGARACVEFRSQVEPSKHQKQVRKQRISLLHNLEGAISVLEAFETSTGNRALQGIPRLHVDAIVQLSTTSA